MGPLASAAAQLTPAQRAARAVEIRSEAAASGDRVIIGFKANAAAVSGVSPGGARLVSQAAQNVMANRVQTAYGVQVREQLTIIPAAVASISSAADIADLLADPNVEYVEAVTRHELIGARNLKPIRGPFVETIPWGITKIDAPGAWTFASTKGAGAKVGIMDTGGDIAHQDLLYAGGIWLKNNSTSSADWADNIVKCGGHGTHVAGTVAARSNTLGVVGVAPEVSLYALKVFEIDRAGTDNCYAYSDVWIKGLQYAVANGIGVVNMSFGGGSFNSSEQSAVTVAANAGLKMIVAAGNGNSGVLSYPAGYTGVIPVAATDVNDARAYFSNYGPHIEVAAPGVDVLSTLPGNNYASYQGTSMAAPHVTGLTALMIAKKPSITIAEVRIALRAGAVDLGVAGRDNYFGYGRINARSSMASVMGLTVPATALAVTRHPAGATSGQAFSTQPIVQLVAANGTAVAQSSVVITAAIATGTGSLGGTLTATTDSTGKATFTNLSIGGTGTFTLRFTSSGLTQATSASFSVNAVASTPIANNSVFTGLTGATGGSWYYVISVPAGATQLSVSKFNGTGNIDIAVRRGALPAPGVADCLSTSAGNVEHCAFAVPVAGDYFIQLYGYSAFSAVTFAVSYQTAAAVTKLTMIRQPAAAVSGAPFGTQPIIQLADASGAPVAQAGVVVTAAVATGPGSLAFLPQNGKSGGADVLGSVTAQTDSAGRANFTDLTIIGTGAHTLSFSATSLTPVTSASFTVSAPTPTSLTSGVAITNLTGAEGSGRSFTIVVPTGATKLEIVTTGGSGDPDIYVRRGAEATFSLYDCNSLNVTSNENCTINSPTAGTWYILLHGYSAYTGVSLTATVTAAAGQSKLIMDRQPSGAVSGSPLTVQPIVALQTAAGAPIAVAGVVVDVTITSGAGNLLSVDPAAREGHNATAQDASPSVVTTATTDASGKATFSGLKLVGAGSVTLTFSAGGYTPIASASVSIADPTPTTLTSNAPQTVSASLDAVKFYKITVPAGASELSIKTSGGTGDVDLYMRSGGPPNFSTYDCRPYLDGTVETCTVTAPPAGDYWLMLHAWATYAGVTLNASVTMTAAATKLGITRQPSGAVTGSVFAIQPLVQLQNAAGVAVSQAGVSVTASINSGTGSLTGTVTKLTDAFGRAEFTDLKITGIGAFTLKFVATGLTTVTSTSFDVVSALPTSLTSGVALTNRAGAFGSMTPYSIVVPSGASQLRIDISTGTGDADLYVRFNQLPTFDGWDCRPYIDGNVETCTFASPAAGTWYIMLHGWSDYSGVTLMATVSTGSIATKLGIVRQPDGASSGTPFAIQPIIELRSATDAAVAIASVPVTASIQSGPGVLTSARPPKNGQMASNHGTPIVALDTRTIQTDASGRANFTDLVITGTGPHTISFTSTGLTGITSQSFNVAPPTPTDLISGVAVTNISATAPLLRYFRVTVPPGATQLAVNIVGNNGDADLYVRYGSAPDYANYDCRPYISSSTESCTFVPADSVTTITPGVYYIMIDPYNSYTGLSLTATYTGGSTTPTSVAIITQPGGAVSGAPMTTQPVVELRNASGAVAAVAGVEVCAEVGLGGGVVTNVPNDSVMTKPGVTQGLMCALTNASGRATFTSLTITGAGTQTIVFYSGSLSPATSSSITVSQPTPTTLAKGVAVTNISGAFGTAKYYRLTVPASQAQLTFTISGGTGDVDLYVQKTTAPTLTAYDCRPFLDGNAETCTLNDPAGGDYLVMLFGWADYTGVTLTGNYTSAPSGIVVRLTALDTATVSAGANFTLPVIVDLSQLASGANLAAMTYNVSWNTSRFTYVSHAAGAFGTSTVNTSETGTGLLRVSLLSDTGATSTFTTMSLVLKATAEQAVTSIISPAVTAAGNSAGANILASITVKPVNVCIEAGGLWGDVNGDGVVNILDAAQIARFAVGLSVVDQATLLARGDVTNDGLVNIIDAQQIARAAAGLSAAERIGQSSSSGCG